MNKPRVLSDWVVPFLMWFAVLALFASFVVAALRAITF